MKPFYLVETVTKDKLVHQGIYFEPKKKGKRAILWVHGLTDNFYGDIELFEAFADSLGTKGYGLASFNTRGHDVVTSIRKLDPRTEKGYTHVLAGSAYEEFRQCLFDIDAGISFLLTQGFREVIIAGASTGANKVCYYAGTKNDPRVAGVILVSPVSDVPIEQKNPSYAKNLRFMKEQMNIGNGNIIVEGRAEIPLTPKRFISLYTQGGKEDVFDYYQSKPTLTKFRKITKPLCVIMGEKDEYVDRPVKDIMSIYTAYHCSRKYKSISIPDAFHSLGGKEKEAVRSIISWANSI